ncbi:hypothetical protein TCAP_01512 [Tolypocladium capitatum]|uniref:Uncharacterized protein n=1 Tax=Tolypocladium capitatum TaxID=45235 RepID=A0A2K3QM04_9HYPO|nr:hypothetical protein TCAP_01512 [Tolypocladium capitatum]
MAGLALMARDDYMSSVQPTQPSVGHQHRHHPAGCLIRPIRPGLGESGTLACTTRAVISSSTALSALEWHPTPAGDATTDDGDAATSLGLTAAGELVLQGSTALATDSTQTTTLGLGVLAPSCWPRTRQQSILSLQSTAHHGAYPAHTRRDGLNCDAIAAASDLDPLLPSLSPIQVTPPKPQAGRQQAPQSLLSRRKPAE